MAEVSSKIIQELAPNLPGTNKRLVYVAGTSAANNDVLTVSDLTSLLGAYLVASDGTVGTLTFATNVITLTNGGMSAWTGLAWGT